MAVPAGYKWRILVEAKVRFDVEHAIVAISMLTLYIYILYAAGTVTPKAMKLCVIGAEGAGKTTLLEALKRGWFR